MKQKFKVGSLFAGVGGICLGFMNTQNKNIEYEMVWANEIDEYACHTYKTNFDHTLIEGDINLVLRPERVTVIIRELKDNIMKLKKDLEESNNIKEIQKTNTEIRKANREKDELEEKQKAKYYENMKDIILSEEIDVLTGGFPCQAFSIAGERKGFKDERGNLFLSIIDLIEQLGEKHRKPRILFLENVKNLKSHDKGRTYKIIKSELEKTGYTIYESVLNAMTYSDLPQNRERIYIIGFLDPKDAEKFTMFSEIENFSNHKTSIDRKNDIKKIIDDNVSKEKYYYTREKYPHYFVKEDEFKYSEESKKNNRINLDEEITEKYQFYQLRRGMYVRKNKSNVCPTLTANMGTGGHNVPLIKVEDGIRKLTPAETFKLQGFPIGDGFEFPEKFKGRAYPDSRLYKQAGNAVPVPVIKLIAEELAKALDDKKGI